MPESLKEQFRKEKKLFRALQEYIKDERFLIRRFGLIKNIIRLIEKIKW